MKLFIVGSDKIYAIENFYVKYLTAMGVEVFHFSAQSLFYDYYQKNILNKLLFKIGVSQILNSVNSTFRSEVEKFKPDIIWIFKGMEIFPKSLKWAKSRNIKLVNFNGDSPFIFSGKGSGNSNVSGSIPLYDLFLTYNGEDKKTMEAQFKIRSEMLPFGFNLDDELYEECAEVPEVKKVCFLGNPDSFRGNFIDSLAAMDVKIDVYGNNWNKFVSHSNIKIFQPVYGKEFWRVLRKYRIQLNLLRPHNPTTHNMRTFEAAGIGAIQLAPYTTDHSTYFTENKEIFLYDSIESCYKQVNRIMHFPDVEALQIRQSVRQRSIKMGYNYEARASQALKFLNELNLG